MNSSYINSAQLTHFCKHLMVLNTKKFNKFQFSQKAWMHESTMYSNGSVHLTFCIIWFNISLQKIIIAKDYHYHYLMT